MNKGLVLLSFFAIPFFVSAQTVLQLEKFTNYLGNLATVPAGWNFSYQGNYTSVASSGVSGPNSYKFGVTLATINTPPFSLADTVKFWVKGISTDAISKLVCMESPDSIAWDTVARINPLPTTGTSFSYHINSLAHHLRFTYVKSVGNVAFDDYSLLRNNATSSGAEKIIVYFNNPVNTSVSSGVPAIYLNQTIDDTLIAYIDRAKYSLDIAVYNFIQSAAISNIATAINNAYSRGVKIRWIYNGSSSNTGLTQLNLAIPTLASPTTSSYNIMHNKFMIVDAHSNTLTDPIVWTGSTNWDAQQINYDFNNVVIVQDKNLAAAYTAEFNEMWGDTGMVANVSTSKFGPFKTDNTVHSFNIGGRYVEMYFSPSDGVENKILAAIGSANNNLYFGVYTFTESTVATAINNKIQSGIYAAGIMDPNSLAYSAYSILNPVMGNMLKVYSGSYLYHNKFLLVDQCDSTSDPLVLTGSHNWTASADTKNDENTLVIHSAIIANMFYQSFNQNFIDLSGTLTSQCLSTGISYLSNENVRVFPNPSVDEIFVETNFSGGLVVDLYDMTGKKVLTKASNGGIKFPINTSDLSDGIYLMRICTDKKTITKKIIIAHN